MHKSTQRQEALIEACKVSHTTFLNLVRAVKTRWNSHAQNLLRTGVLATPVKLLCLDSALALGQYALNSAEWKILMQLSPTLQIFINATHYVSRHKTPLLYQIIPLIDKLDSHLLTLMKPNTGPNGTGLHSTIRHAAYFGRTMLNKYYSKTDGSIMYRVAMSKFFFHSRYVHCLTCFRVQSFTLAISANTLSTTDGSKSGLMKLRESLAICGHASIARSPLKSFVPPPTLHQVFPR